MMKRWLGRLFLLLLGVVLSLGVLEIVARRVARQHVRPRTDRPLYYYDPGQFRPFRDRIRSATKPPNTVRILCVGDSFTWGYNVQFDDAYPARLERLLQLLETNPRYEVLNWGVEATGTGRHRDLIRRGLAYRPDYVILGYYLNDPDPRVVPRELYPVRWSPRVRWLMDHFALARWFARRWLAMYYARAHAEYYNRLFAPDSRWYHHHVLALRRIRQTLAEHRIPWAVVIWPVMYAPFDRDRYPFQHIHARIHHLLDEMHVPYLDLLDVFRGMDPERLQTIPYVDPHPNEIAHRLAAQAIFIWGSRTLKWWPSLAPHRWVPNEHLRRLRMWERRTGVFID